MKFLFSFILCWTSLSLSAQQTTYWKGGTPGKENAWNIARNWSNQKIPDENTHVIIQDKCTGHFAQPTIEDSTTIASLKIQGAMILTIKENAVLSINGRYTYSQGITNEGGLILNNGILEVKDVDQLNTLQSQEYIRGKGRIILDSLQLVHNK